MRNFFKSIPKEIVESARSDGASNMTIFKRIVCPLAKSTIMLIVLFSFTGSWNSLTWPQLLLSGGLSYWKTITVALTGYAGGNAWSKTGVAMATSVFALMPIIIIFIITQDKMIDGLASTGVKG
jgi:multiple sugar transport system permease protein